MEHVLVLRPHLLKEADYQRKVFHVVLEAGTGLDEVLAPNFWVHNTSRLKPLQKIEVLANDGSWYAELIVRSVSRAAAKVAVITHKVLEDPAASSADIGLASSSVTRWSIPSWSLDVRAQRTSLPSRSLAACSISPEMLRLMARTSWLFRSAPANCPGQ